MIKAGEQLEPTNGKFPEEYMAALYEYIDNIEFIPALQIGDKVEFVHNGESLTGTVDWLMGDGCVSVMVKGHERPFLGEEKTFKRI